MSTPQQALSKTAPQKTAAQASGIDVVFGENAMVPNQKSRKIGLATRLVIHFTAFIAISLSLVAFSGWEISIALQGGHPFMPAPAGIVLLIASVGLVAEFIFGFRVSLKELGR